MSHESLLARSEQAAGQVLAFGRLLAAADIAAGIDAVTSRDIAALGRSLIEPGRSTVSVLGPKGAMDAARRFDAALAA